MYKAHRTRATPSEPSGSYGPWLMTTKVNGVSFTVTSAPSGGRLDSGGGSAWGGAGAMWRLWILLNVAVNLKLLKKKKCHTNLSHCSIVQRLFLLQKMSSLYTSTEYCVSAFSWTFHNRQFWRARKRIHCCLGLGIGVGIGNDYRGLREVWSDRMF